MASMVILGKILGESGEKERNNDDDDAINILSRFFFLSLWHGD